MSRQEIEKVIALLNAANIHPALKPALDVARKVTSSLEWWTGGQFPDAIEWSHTLEVRGRSLAKSGIHADGLEFTIGALSTIRDSIRKFSLTGCGYSVEVFVSNEYQEIIGIIAIPISNESPGAC